MLPVTYKEWDSRRRLLKGIVRTRSTRRIVEDNANWLLERLYKPDVDGYRLNRELAAPMHEEPINWGDLSAGVERKGGVWIVTLEEASPGQCPTLCWYVQGWLEKWGWTPTIVQTEW